MLGDVIASVSAIAAATAVLFLTEAGKYNEGYIIVFYVMLITSVFAGISGFFNKNNEKETNIVESQI